MLTLPPCRSLDLKTARKLLGPDAIIGVTASSEDEALEAAKDGADYLGIGTVYATPTKEDTKSIIGTAGVQQILTSLASAGRDVKTVCIGGIKASNAQRVLYQSASAKKKLDGVCIHIDISLLHVSIFRNATTRAPSV